MKASESRKTDRIIVISCAAVGLGLAAFAIVKAQGFSQLFPKVSEGNSAKGQELLSKAAALVEETKKAEAGIANSAPAKWETASAAGKQRGFLASTGLVFRRGATEANDSIIDLDKPEPRLREAFPNEFWLKYPGLQLQHANVGDLDPDQDYFSNALEFQMSEKLGKEFSPVDPKSHPPMHLLLRFAQFDEAVYDIKFTTASPPEFGLRHEDPDKEKRWNDTTILNEDVNGNGQLDEGEDKNFNQTLDAAKPAGKKGDEKRFVVIDVKMIEVETDGFKESKHQITVEDTFRPAGHPDRKFQITEGETKSLGSKTATFDYLPRPGAPIIKREFEKFTLPDAPTPSYVLKSVDAEKAIVEIEGAGAKTQVVYPRGQAPTP